jgi:hypothetical protein
MDKLIEKYKRDFSTDKTYGQLSVVDILRESIDELVSIIPEIAALPKERKEEVEAQILIFCISLYDEGRNYKN